MTPRELIADELLTINPGTPDLAGRILARLEYNGFVIVPRVATDEMTDAAKWALLRWREASGRRQAEVLPDEKHAIRWSAMVAVAETSTK